MKKFLQSKFFSVMSHILIAGIAGAATPVLTAVTGGNTEHLGILAAGGAVTAIAAVLKTSPFSSPNTPVETVQATPVMTVWDATHPKE